MPRSIPTTITSYVESITNRPVELVEVYLDTGTLYRAISDDDLSFEGQTYTALGLERSGVRTSSELETDELTLKLDNVDLGFSARVIAEDFVTRRARVRKMFRDAPTSGNAIVLFDGRM